MAQGDFREILNTYKELEGKDLIAANILIGTLLTGALVGFVPPVREGLANIGELIGVLPDTTVSYGNHPPALEDLYGGAAIQAPAPAELPTGPAPTEIPTLPEGFLAD